MLVFDYMWSTGEKWGDIEDNKNFVPLGIPEGLDCGIGLRFRIRV